MTPFVLTSELFGDEARDTVFKGERIARSALAFEHGPGLLILAHAIAITLAHLA